MSCCPEALNDGRSAAGGRARLLASDTTPQSLIAAGVETTIGSFVIPASTLQATGDRVRLTVGGDLLFTTARTANWGFRIGGATVVFPSPGAFGASAQRRPWDWDVMLVRTGALTGRVHGQMFAQNNAAAPVAGFGSFAAGSLGGSVGSAVADLAIDWSLAQTVEIRAIMSLVNADDLTRRDFCAELLRV